MFDGDLQARAKDRDRDQALYVIAAALRNGQISQQDHDLRVERVHSSTTVGDLGALVRDIATPPVPVPSTAVVPPVPVAPAPAPTATSSPYAPSSTRPVDTVPSDLYGPPPSAKKNSPSKTVTSAAGARKFFVGCFAVVFLAILAPIVFGVIIFAFQSNGAGSTIPDTEPIVAGPPFELTGAGLRAFVTAFDDTFDDTAVTRAVFYDGYVVAWVPDGEGHESIWDYTDGAFTQLGDPMDDTEETGPVDLADLRPAKVMGLIRTAIETLGVSDTTTTYVIFDRGVINDQPQLAVYVSNEDGDSGYLLADLDGTVLTSAGAG